MIFSVVPNAREALSLLLLGCLEEWLARLADPALRFFYYFLAGRV